MLPIHNVTIHCAATPEGRANTAKEVTAWDVERFGQPSYHYVIEIDGKVVATLPEDRLGAHTGGRNTGNLGVCYVGGLAKDGKTPKDTRTVGQRAAMKKLIAELKAKHPGVKVLGHRDWPNVKKACPSFDCASWLKDAGL